MANYGKGAWAAGVAVWLAACGGALGKPTAGGESHFLGHCLDGCGDLDCVADLCTKVCAVDGSSCSDLSAQASCTNVGMGPGGVAVCDVACTSDDECGALGAAFSCQNGVCRSPSSLSDSGAAGAGGTSGGSTSITIGGGTPLEGSSGELGTGAAGPSLECTPVTGATTYPGLTPETCADRNEAPCLPASQTFEDALSGPLGGVLNDCGGLPSESAIQVEFSDGCAAVARASLTGPETLRTALVTCVMESLNAVRFSCAAATNCAYQEVSTLR